MLALGNQRFGSAFFSETGRHTPLAASQHELVSLIDNSKVNARYSINPDSINSHPLQLAGVKRVGERIVATNRPAAEDDPSHLSEDRLEDLLDGTNFSVFENDGSSDPSATDPVWQLFLIVALAFLIIEALLCLNKKPKKKSAPQPAPRP